MKKLQKIVGTALALVVSIGAFSGCSTETTTMESPDNSFSLTLPDVWTEYEKEVNGQSIAVTNNREDCVLTIERVPNLSLSSAMVKEDTDTFLKDILLIDYDDIRIEDTDTALEVPNMEVKTTKEVYGKIGDQEQKVYSCYLESEMNGYYITLESLEKSFDRNIRKLQEAMATFQEHTEVLTQKPETISDTVLWFNTAYALMTIDYGYNVFYVGGANTEDKVSVDDAKTSLQSSGIVDKASATTVFSNAKETGQNATGKALYDSLQLGTYSSKEEMVADMSGYFGEEELAILEAIYDARQKFGENALLGWDNVLLLQLYGDCYLAGYYTYEEAMDASYTLATELQQAFSSWDEMMESYFYGYQCFLGVGAEDEETEVQRERQLYEDIKASAWNPYTLDWNTPLEKTW